MVSFSQRRRVTKQETEVPIMTYTQHYDSPLGGILLAADDVGLTGLWFDGQKYFARGLSNERIEQETSVLTETKRWLDIYFTGKAPDFTPPLHPIGRAHTAHGRALTGLQVAERLDSCHCSFPLLRRRAPPIPMVFDRALLRAGGLRAGAGCSILQENTCIRSDRYGREAENECGQIL